MLGYQMIEVKAHAKLSASGSARWLNCPGSIELSLKAPPQVDSVYAAEGTRAHLVLETILRAKNPRARAEMLRGEFPDEMIDHALDAFKYIESITPKGAQRFAETKVMLPDEIGPDMYGTIDCAIVELFGELIVIDYKYGAGIAVSPEGNTQLIYYALGLAYKYDFNFDTVRLIIIQPRAYHEAGPIREAVMGMKILETYISLFREGVSACNESNAKLRAGYWCRFCPAATICPELTANAMKDAGGVFDIVTAESLITPPIPIGSTDPKNLAALLVAADKLEFWIDAVRTFAFQKAERGGKIPGYKLVQKRSTRKWVNDVEVGILAKFKHGEGAFTKPELLSPAQFEKATGDKDFVETHATSVSSGVTLVPESDKRPAVVEAHEVFSVVEDSPKLAEKNKQIKPKKGKSRE